MAERLAGKEVALAVKEWTKEAIEKLRQQGKIAKLAIVRVGQRPDDLYYEQGLTKTCQNVGLAYQVVELPGDAGQQEIETAVSQVAADETIHGILLFSPLPKSIDENAVRRLIPAEKDVDCLTLAGAALVFAGRKEGFPPCTPAAVMEILRYYQVPLAGRKAVVLGRSMVVGKPLAMLLLNENATVTICHSKTADLPAVCRDADVLVAAVGRAKMVDENYVRPGQVVIDVGINPDPEQEGKMCGDVAYDKVEPVVAQITPVPGGVGSVTSAMLCKHTVLACARACGVVL